jgi:hypothetical protein
MGGIQMTMGMWQTTTPAPGMGRIVVDCSYPAGAGGYAMAGVTIAVNGSALRSNWGPTSIDLPPGRHFIEVSARYLRRTGAAGTWVPVTPGQTTMVFYRAPAMTFMGGSIGPVPQPTRGFGVQILVAMVLLVIPLLMMLLIIYSRR